MFLPRLEDDQNTRELISAFYGYNHNYRIRSGEFYDMENLSSDNFPLFSPRGIRTKVKESAGTIRGLLLTSGETGADLAWLENAQVTENEQTIDKVIMHIGSRDYDLTDMMDPADTSEQQLLRFGAYILIFPAGVYVNVFTTETGTMGDTVTVAAGEEITYTLCDSEGSPYQNISVRPTPPANPSDGDYWLCTDASQKGLYMWQATLSMWQPVPTTYIKVHIPGPDLTQRFAVGDSINLNGHLSDINDGSIIQAIGEDYVVVIGLMNRVTDSDVSDASAPLTISRKIPQMDYVCVSKNRVWGCYYGRNADREMVNEIYASKLGDFKNWYSYEGLSTDSYALSLGEDGFFTGCISYQGYPTFFKENHILRIFGSSPAEYQLSSLNARGVQRGSYRSLAVLNEMLIYKSATDICVFDGSTPTSISEALGRDTVYYDGVAGATLDKYYISVVNALDHAFNFVYDMAHGIWEREDSNIRVEHFSASENGQVYAATHEDIYGIGSKDNWIFSPTEERPESEKYVSWFAETGDLGLDTPVYKKLKRLTIRAFVPHRSEIQIYVSYEDRPYDELVVLRGNATITTQSIPIKAFRADHFKLRFVGHGDVRIYSIAMTYEENGEENGEYRI